MDDLCDIATRLDEVDPRDAAKFSEKLDEFEHQKAECGFQELPAAVLELVGIISQGLNRADRLVAGLRDFASPRAGGKSSVEVLPGLRSTLQLLHHGCQEAGVRVETSWPDWLPRTRGNPAALNQVFLNLLKNALDALKETGGTIRVEAREEDDAVVVVISDDGPGIAPEARDRLFEPFFTTKAASQGTGLGLSISRRIVVGLGGSLQLESAEGKGTRAVLRLPLDDPDAG